MYIRVCNDYNIVYWLVRYLYLQDMWSQHKGLKDWKQTKNKLCFLKWGKLVTFFTPYSKIDREH